MKKISYSIVLMLIMNHVFSVCAMSGSPERATDLYSMRQASHLDAEGVVRLMNAQAYKDSDKIVIVPEKFRSAYVETAIRDGRLFIALHGTEVVAYKKLFCITDQAELDDILCNELRLKGTQECSHGLVYLPVLDFKNVPEEEVAQAYSVPATYLYTGADFTHPDHRAKGVNTKLTQYALNAVSEDVVRDINHKQSASLALVYGLTRANAGKETTLLDGRTHGILKQFVPFVHFVAQRIGCMDPLEIYIKRNHAFKPSFDPQDTECKPLEDERAISGYGYLLACALKRLS